MTFEFGDVLVVEFPFTDGSRVKRRPAVVVSSADYNATRPDVVMVAITSQLKASHDDLDVLIQGWEDAGLAKPSVLKPVIFTLEARFIRGRLGSLSGPDALELRGLLTRILA